MGCRTPIPINHLWASIAPIKGQKDHLFDNFIVGIFMELILPGILSQYVIKVANEKTIELNL